MGTLESDNISGFFKNSLGMNGFAYPCNTKNHILQEMWFSNFRTEIILFVPG